MGILRSGETKSEIFPELQIVSPDRFERVERGRMQRSAEYLEKCAAYETVTLEDGSETVTAGTSQLSQKKYWKGPAFGQCILRSLRWPHFCVYGTKKPPCFQDCQ